MKNRVEIISITITLVISTLLGFISIELMGEYGFLLFVLIPILIGFLPVYMTTKSKPMSRSWSYTISFVTLGLAFLCLLLFAIEGIVCLVMAFPFVALLTWFGSYLAYFSQSSDNLNSKNTSILLILTSILFLSFDAINKPKELISVDSEIIVNANIQTVWKNVIEFGEIKEPNSWIFKTGISYPINATIEGIGVGAIRYCNFTTGSFVEPITTWEEPNLLQFDVKEQPIPMNEFNPFWEVHPPHLDGYFKSQKGQFKLTSLNRNRTKLEGTTWYLIDIAPKFYWTLWSDFIVSKIHDRVLEHIKLESE